MSEASDHIGKDPDLPDDDTLAAEYVLGVLDASARVAAERRIARERGFAALVEGWQIKLVPWADDIAPVQPPHEVWNRIVAALPAERPAGQGLWGSLMLWRWLTAGAGALAVASLLALFVVLNAPAPPSLVASIEGGGNRQFVATISPGRNTVSVLPAGYANDPARVPELWLIAPGDKPRSLGLVKGEQPVALAIPADLRRFVTDASTLAISLEPPGGSPTGSPTGPVIAQGKLTAL
jgi:anti-sigma-K factor RskA